MGRRLLPLFFAVAAPSLPSSDANPTHCGPPFPNGTSAPCGPGNQLCPFNGTGNPGMRKDNAFSQLGPYGMPVGYHIRDLTCGLNDPNGPVYDPHHGVYHLFYQDHLGMPSNAGGAVVWGHVASRDMRHWAHLPVALWNDQPYDNQAIFSGSATVVNGTVVLVYPGLCDTQNADGGENKQCLSGRNLATAVPADPTDPLLKQWRKRGIIVANSNGNQSHPYAKPDDGKDPSTAWQTAFGEWRFVTGGTPIMYGSMDFDNWYLLGLGFTTKMQSCSPCLSNGYPCTNSDCFVGAGGDCPSLFPLPGRTPGAGPSPDNKTEPTHVHMSFGGSMSLGWMEDGAPRSVGNWTDAGPFGFPNRKSDHGNYYATKDFWDPVKNRRILWGWGVPPLNAESLPRHVTWNPELRQLCYSPLEEQSSLRAKSLAVPSRAELKADVPLVISSGWLGSEGNQSEILVDFPLPKTGGALFGLIVMGGTDPAVSGTFLFVEYSQPREGAGWPRSVTVGAISNRTAAQNASTPGHFSCNSPGVQCANDTLQLTERDTSIRMRAFVDNNLAECYWQENRVAIMVPAPPTAHASVALYSNVSLALAAEDAVKAWTVGDIWISEDQLLATPRPDVGMNSVTGGVSPPVAQ